MKRGLRFVRGGEKELVEKLGREDPCPCGSGKSFQALLPRRRPVSTGRSATITGASEGCALQPVLGRDRRTIRHNLFPRSRIHHFFLSLRAFVPSFQKKACTRSEDECGILRTMPVRGPAPGRMLPTPSGLSSPGL